MIVYKTYQHKDLAIEEYQILRSAGIACKLRDNSPNLDITMSMNTLQNQYQLVIDEKDEQNARKVLEEAVGEDSLPEDHYLHEFSNEELFEIVTKSDEWSEFDFKHSVKLLEERGVSISAEKLEELKKRRILELSKPKSLSASLIWVTYISALLGGLIGLVGGYQMLYNQKRLPNGAMVFTYDQATRSHGKSILFISTGVLIVSILIFLI